MTSPERWVAAGALAVAAALTASSASSAPVAALPRARSVVIPKTVAVSAAPAVRDVDQAVVRRHLEQLQAVADANGGHRSTGSSGDDATVDYVAGQLEAAGYAVTRQAVSTPSGPTTNLVAELAGADPSAVLMIGAHLDSVDEGPGLNDNGSGGAAAIATAQALAAVVAEPAVTVRFAWWGGEELGMLGSQAYVDGLSADGLGAITGYLNIDMLGSPNGGYFVYDDDPALEQALYVGLAAQGVRGAPETGADGRSDHDAFAAAGVPVGGLSSGAEGTKSEQEAQRWGGTAGQPYDPCYHASCDDLGNVDLGVLDTMADALAHAVWALAVPAVPALVDARRSQAS